MTTLKRLLPLVALVALLGLPSLATPALAQTSGSSGNTAVMPGRESATAPEKKPPALFPPITGDGSAQTWFDAMWVLIIFLILVVVLYPTAWKNVLAGLKKREERIRGDIADAESARLKAEATLREYNQQLTDAQKRINDMLSQAALDAEKIGASIRLQAQHDAEQIKDRALKEIEAEKESALNEIYQQTAELSTSIAEKILRRNLNADDQRELVNEGLQMIGAMV